MPFTIDTTFDIRSDSGGKDPDRCSPTLREYHRRLWSRPLPNGVVFTLVDRWPNAYLRHTSSLGDFHLSSDMIIRTFRHVLRMRHIIKQVPEVEQLDFSRRGCTIGGTIIFPGNRIGGDTINQARGKNRSIEDRFDLTLECIRRHYSGNDSPLAGVLSRYSHFFALFGDFRGYVDFFLLQDLVTDDYKAVRFFSDWNDFSAPALPSDLDAYTLYRKRTITFVDARNARIKRLDLDPKNQDGQHGIGSRD